MTTRIQPVLTQPLRDEHQALLPNIEFLRDVAEMVGEVPLETLERGIEAVCDFLRHELIPHAQAEDRALYPVVARVMGATEATATMRRDHVEIGRLADELDALRLSVGGPALHPAQVKDLRRVLYGLYSLVRVHFAKEEDVYLPLLDARLLPSEAREMFEALEAAAHMAKTAAD